MQINSNISFFILLICATSRAAFVLLMARAHDIFWIVSKETSNMNPIHHRLEKFCSTSNQNCSKKFTKGKYSPQKTRLTMARVDFLSEATLAKYI